MKKAQGESSASAVNVLSNSCLFDAFDPRKTSNCRFPAFLDRTTKSNLRQPIPEVTPDLR